MKHEKPKMPGMSAKPAAVKSGKAGGVIAAKAGPLTSAVKGMGHSQAPLSNIATDRGPFKIKG